MNMNMGNFEVSAALGQLTRAPAISAMEASRLAGEDLPGKGKAAEAGELAGAARDFEAVFYRMLLREMMPKEDGGLFGSGPSAGIIRGMFVDQVGSSLARGRALGIADLIEETMGREEAGARQGQGSATENTEVTEITVENLGAPRGQDRLAPQGRAPLDMRG